MRTASSQPAVWLGAYGLEVLSLYRLTLWLQIKYCRARRVKRCHRGALEALSQSKAGWRKRNLEKAFPFLSLFELLVPSCDSLVGDLDIFGFFL